MVINQSWGTKRTCPSCGAHFYDLNKLPASCPKCNHAFDPSAVVRAKRKTTRRDAPEMKKDTATATVLAPKKPASRRKEKDPDDQGGGEGGIGDIAEIEDVDDIENLRDLSELEEREETPVNGDDADDEAIIDDLDAGDKIIVGSIEEEEAQALESEIDEEEVKSPSPVKKGKAKKKPK